MSFIFILVELSVYLFTAFCLWEAWKLGRGTFATVLVAMFFGFAIEYYFVATVGGYVYGNFLVMLGSAAHKVPLWVSLGWGTIIFAAMQASDRMGLPWFLRPVTDGLLAVSVDLTLDPVAEALGFWNWTREGFFYGVPFDNFIGWLMIVGAYSFMVRAGFKIFKSATLLRDILVPLGALVPAVGLVVGLQFLLDMSYGFMGEPLTFSLIFALSITVSLISMMWSDIQSELRWYHTLVPVYFHGLMIALLFASGLYLTHPTLIIMMPLALGISVMGFRGMLAKSGADSVQA